MKKYYLLLFLLLNHSIFCMQLTSQNFNPKQVFSPEIQQLYVRDLEKKLEKSESLPILSEFYNDIKDNKKNLNSLLSTKKYTLLYERMKHNQKELLYDQSHSQRLWKTLESIEQLEENVLSFLTEYKGQKDESYKLIDHLLQKNAPNIIDLIHTSREKQDSCDSSSSLDTSDFNKKNKSKKIMDLQQYIKNVEGACELYINNVMNEMDTSFQQENVYYQTNFKPKEYFSAIISRVLTILYSFELIHTAFTVFAPHTTAILQNAQIKESC